MIGKNSCCVCVIWTCKDVEIKNLWEYHDLYVESDTLLFTDVFENSRNMCINIYEFYPADFFQLQD